MRTPKRFYAQQRLMYQPALLPCPHCGDLLVMGNSLAWKKTVQTLDRVLSVASRPGRCPHEPCAGSRLRLLSAEAQRMALPPATSGYDVLVRLGWWRSQPHATSREMHAELASHGRISVAQVRSLSPPVSLPLLACHERQHWDRLAQLAKAPGGWRSALDGLAPAGGEPQRWCMRELTRGLTWRSGWRSPQDHPPFEAFLPPLTQLQWPMLAVLSDQHTGLRPAVPPGLLERRSQFCQAHYLRHLAEPLAAADAAFTVDLRKAVRQPGGDVLRQDPRATPGPSGVVTVTGLCPSPLGPPPAPLARAAQSPPPSAAPATTGPEAEALGTALLRHPRSLRTLKGRPPLRLAGLETSERLDHGARVRLAWVAERDDPRLVQLAQGLPSALSPCAALSQALQQGAAWLRDLAYL